MTIRVRSAVLRVPLLVLATLFLAGLGAAAAMVLSRSGIAAGNPPTCGLASGTLTVHLTGGTLTLTSDGTDLQFSSTDPTCGGNTGEPWASISDIEFAVATTVSTPSTIVLDQTGTEFPCVPIGGQVGTSGNNDGKVEIVAAAGESVTLGSNGVNLDPTSTSTPPPVPQCGGTVTSPSVSPFTSGTFTGLQSYQIVEAGNPPTGISGITLSAGGGDGTGSATAVPVTVSAGSTQNKTTSAVSGSHFIGGNGTSNTFTVLGGGGNTYVVGTGTTSFTDTGTTTNNILDFSNASASLTSHLAVNVSGSSTSVGGTTVQTGQAALGSTVLYNFSSATANDPSPFKTIIGASAGDTDFFGGDQTSPTNLTGFNFETQGSGNSADFSASKNSICAELGAYPATITNASGLSCLSNGPKDKLTPLSGTPITTVTGSSAGGDLFHGGESKPASSPCGCALTYTFTGNGSGNVFFAGTGSSGPGSAIYKGGSGNIVDLAFLNSQAIVDDSGQSGISPPTGTATAGGASFDFSGLSSPTTLIGSNDSTPGESTTKFYGGTNGDNFFSFVGNAELDYGFLNSGTLTVCAALPTSGACSQNVPTAPTGLTSFTGQAVIGTVHEGFSGINKFDGLNGGTTTFADGDSTASTPGGNNFVPTGGTNKADFSQVGAAIKADLSSGTAGVVSDVASGSGLLSNDNINSISSVIDSSKGGNVDIAGPTSDTFADLGTNPTDEIDFSHVTSSSTNPLTINVSGALNGIANDTAQVATTPYYFDSAHANSQPDFTSFLGSNVANEKTIFLASGTGGYTFSGQAADTADFTATTSVNVNLTNGWPGTVTVPTANGSGSSTDTLEATSPATIGPTTINGGSSGKNVFQWGDDGPFTFNGEGTESRFVAGSDGSGSSDATLEGGSNNIVDLSNLTSAATVNDSGVAGGSPATGTATSGNARFNFASLGSPTTFIGTSDTTDAVATKFFGGITADNFVGAAQRELATLTAATGTSSISSLTVSPLTGPVSAGEAVIVTSGGNSQTFAASAPASAGATSISINSATPVTNFPSGAFVSVPTTTSNELSYASAPSSSLLVCAAKPTSGSCLASFPAHPGVPTGTPAIPTFTGQAVLGGAIHEGIFDIDRFDGLGTQGSSTPTTTFADGNSTASTPGGNDFVPTAGTNTADFSQVGAAIKADLSSGTAGVVSAVVSGSGLLSNDQINSITSVIDSSQGGNIDIAGPTSETFSDQGSNPTDTMDFSHVASSATNPLTINVSGALNGIANDSAAVGSATYFFDLAHANSQPDFTSFVGSTTPNPGEKTIFLASGAGGFSFSGLAADTADFTAASSGVTVDLASGWPGTVAGLASGVSSSTTDSLKATAPATTGPTTINGASAAGNVFEWGNDGPFTFNGETASTITPTAPGSRFVPESDTSSASNATLLGGTKNIVDLSHLTNAATVNDSGVAGGSPATGLATAGGATFNFGGLSPSTTFIGTDDTIDATTTTFDGGITADNFVGTAGTNELSYASLTSGTLLVCAAEPTSGSCLTGFPSQPPVPSGTPSVAAFSGQAVLGGAIHQGISDITTFDGINGGTTTFVDGNSGGAVTGGHNFIAKGGTNSADFSQVKSGITVNLSSAGTNPGEVISSGLNNDDSVSGITNVTGSSNGSNAFGAGSVSEVFQDLGSGHHDLVDFSNVSASTTTPLLVNVSNHPVSGINTDEATLVGTGVTYTFNNSGANFTSFIGSDSGNTRFAASDATGGLTFTAFANTSGNNADFGLSSVGIIADVTSSSPGNVTFVGGSPTADTLAGAFLDSPGNTVTGSGTGSNTFKGAVVGTTFTANSTTNTLSYVNYSTTGVTVDLKTDKITSTASSGADQFNFPNTQKPALQGSPAADTFRAGSTAATIQGGGGIDSLDLSQSTSGDSVSMVSGTNAGSVSGSSIGTLTFTMGCSDPNYVCVGNINGSGSNDTYTANQNALTGAGGLPVLNITGNTGSDTLNLSNVPNKADVCMPISGSSPLSASPCTTQGWAGPAGLGTLTAPSGTSAISSLTVSPTATPVSSGDLIQVVSGGTSPGIAQTFTASAPAPAGATSISVDTATPFVNFPSGSAVADLSNQRILFTGVGNIAGTSPGGDYIWAGSANEQFAESVPNSPATLDLSNLPDITSTQNGVTVSADSAQSGQVSAPLSAGSFAYKWSGFQTIVGTAGNDSFTQTASGTYNFIGLAGTNNLDLSQVPGGPSLTFNPADPTCSAGNNSDGNASIPPAQPFDTWTCMSSVVAPGQAGFNVSPNQSASINGGGSGTINLVNDTAGAGAVVNMTQNPATVTGDGYNFSFTGISKIVGTQFDDTFLPGPSSVTIDGGGGQDGLSYTCPLSLGAKCTSAPNPVDINLSTANYLIPTGYAGAGNSVNGCSAIGGLGGTVNFLNSVSGACTISNGIGTTNNTDILIAGAGHSNLTGGRGNDRFVLTDGGIDQVVAGIGNATLDLSELSGFTAVNLGSPGLQFLPTGTVTLASGTIKTVIASPGGSFLQAGTGNGVTLQGGPGNDILAAGDAVGGTQTLIGGGGNDILLGGIGNDTMTGGAQPVTFIPGEGNDTLVSSATGNTLSYAGGLQGAEANLSSSTFKVPAGKPFAGTTLAANTVTGGFPGSSADISGANITNFFGSPFSDAVVTSGNDTVNGVGGNDLYVVGTGTSTITAGNGTSSYFLMDGTGCGTAACDNILRGGGNSTVDFSSAPAGVTANLQAGSATGGFGGSQDLSGFREVIGSQFADVLVANAPGETIIGLNGKDLLQSGPAGGDTLLGDGGGADTFCSIVCVSGTQAHGGPTPAQANRMVGGSGDDTFFTRNFSSSNPVFIYDNIDGGGGFNQAQVDPQDSTANIQSFLK